MGLGETLERALETYRGWRRRRLPGALGEFYRTGGPERLQADMELGPDELVLDVGGYRGDWTAEMAWRYGCRAMVLEAVPAFQAELMRRFSKNRRVEVIPAGLAAEDGSSSISLLADGSSAFRSSGADGQVVAQMKGVESLFRDHRLEQVGCMKLNIEGGEFEVLTRMLEVGLHRSVKYLLIQFHRVSSDSEDLRRAIQARLAETHALEFDYPFVWERWFRRG